MVRPFAAIPRSTDPFDRRSGQRKPDSAPVIWDLPTGARKFDVLVIRNVRVTRSPTVATTGTAELLGEYAEAVTRAFSGTR